MMPSRTREDRVVPVSAEPLPEPVRQLIAEMVREHAPTVLEFTTSVPEPFMHVVTGRAPGYVVTRYVYL